MADARLRIVASDRSQNPESVLTTGLNSLANAAAALSSAFAADKGETLCKAELTLGTLGGTPADDAPVDLFCVESIDDSTYAREETEGRPREGYVGSFRLNNETTGRTFILPAFPCPIGSHKWYLINNCGQTFAASGNTLKIKYYHELADEP